MCRLRESERTSGRGRPTETGREREREHILECSQRQERKAMLWIDGSTSHKAGACPGRDREALCIRSLRQRPHKFSETPRGSGVAGIRIWPGISPAICLPLPLAGAVACSSRRPHVCLALCRTSSQSNQFSACHGLAEPSRTQTTKPDMKLERPAKTRCFPAFDTPSAPETPAIA